MTEHAVVIAGGGPTGLMLAAELALARVDVVVVERRTDQLLESTRSGGLHARTIEVLDQRGVAERFLAEGQTHPAVGYGQIRLDITDFPTRHNYLLALWQRDFERILADWVVNDLGVRLLRGREVVGVTERDGASTSSWQGGHGSARRTPSAATVGAASSARRQESISRASTRPSAS